MKERIEQIKKDCGFHVGNINLDASTKEIDFLCEMVVKECMALIRWEEFEMSFEQRIRLKIYQDIKEHFGVKE